MGSNWNLVMRAASMAAELHGQQVRRDGTPYFQHPARVATLLARAGADDDLIAAGFLHDVIEDTPADHDDLSAGFSEAVADWVAVMSKDHRLPEGIREPAYKQQLIEGPWQGRAIKLADQIDNFTASMKKGKDPSRKRVSAAEWAIEIAEGDDEPVILALRGTLVSIIEAVRESA